uniref:Leucine-rich repeat protein n=1 Tax=Marseillevirus LCMAC102 TaxID=2506603 RepID=A0A481YVM8_9VIRU|nr:MAG: hypothetical protein LCMAC102_03990 [Marseillevirus LCMAC102]
MSTLDFLITQNYQFQNIFTKHILPKLYLEELCCLLMVTKCLWNQRSNFNTLYLKLKNNNITIEKLRNMPEEWIDRIHTLNFYWNKEIRNADISILKNIRKLDLTCTGITDISAFEGSQNLHTLILYLTDIEDILALGTCPNLCTLDLSSTDVTDISVLGTCKNLHTLNLSDTQVKDISVLGTCKSLNSLSICNTNITDISALGNCTNLRIIYLYDTNINNTQTLKGVTVRGPIEH